MKVVQPNQTNTAKNSKQAEIVFRINRSLQKLHLSSHSKKQMGDQNREISWPCLINSLHLYMNEDKDIPKNYVKRVIEILSQHQTSNSRIDVYRNPIEKTVERMGNAKQRQQTQDVNISATNVERNSQRKESSRIRKVKTRKLFELFGTESKENEAQDSHRHIQKRITELQQKINEYKYLVQLRQKELKEKQTLINTLHQQKQQIKAATAQILKDRLTLEHKLNSQINALRQEMQQNNTKMYSLKTQLIQREAQIVSFWACTLKRSY